MSRNRPGFAETGRSASIPQTAMQMVRAPGAVGQGGAGQELGPAAWYPHADPERDRVSLSSLRFSVLARVQHISPLGMEWSKGKGAAWPRQKDSFRDGDLGQGVQEVRSCLGLRAPRQVGACTALSWSNGIQRPVELALLGCSHKTGGHPQQVCVWGLVWGFSGLISLTACSAG